MCGCQEKLESKWMPKSLVELTRSMNVAYSRFDEW